MFTDPGPRLDVAIIKDDIDKVKNAAAGAEKACKAFEEADLAKIFGAASGVMSVVSIVALGVQIGLMAAGVPSPEERILAGIELLSKQMVSLQKRTEEHLDAVAESLGHKMEMLAWKVPLWEAIRQISDRDKDLRAIRGHLEKGELEAAAVLARPLVESSTARADLLDQLRLLEAHAEDYLTNLAPARSYHYSEVAREGANLLRYAALAWHDANMIGALRISLGRRPDDTSPEPLPPTHDPLALIRQQDADSYGPSYASLASTVKEVLDGLVDHAGAHMRIVAGQIIVTGGPNVRERPRSSEETVAVSIESQLAERWPWLDFAVNTNAQLIRVFLADEEPGAPRAWDAWLVAQEGPKGQRVVLLAAAPRLQACEDPAVEPARMRAVANLETPHPNAAKDAQGPASGNPASEGASQRELAAKADALPSGEAVRGLIAELTLPVDYPEIERRFRTWASTQPTPPGGRMVLVAQLVPYRGRVTNQTGTLGGLTLKAAIVDWATTSPERLKVWCEPQCFTYLGLTLTLLGGFTLA